MNCIHCGRPLANPGIHARLAAAARSEPVSWLHRDGGPLCDTTDQAAEPPPLAPVLAFICEQLYDVPPVIVTGILIAIEYVLDGMSWDGYNRGTCLHSPDELACGQPCSDLASDTLIRWIATRWRDRPGFDPAWTAGT